MDKQLNPNLTSCNTFSYKDILVRKLVRAVALNVISQLFIINLYVIVANIDILHPYAWFYACLNTFTHFSVWFFLVIFSGIIFAQCLICAKDYVLMTSYCSTRFQQFLRIFSVHNFTLVALHMIVGGGLVFKILCLTGGDNRNLISKCNLLYCLNTDTFFLLLSGFWTGFYYFIKIYVTSKHLVFPVIQQRKFLQFRTNIAPLFKDSLTMAIWPTLYFALFYFVWGNKIEHLFMSFFMLKKLEIQSSFLVYIYSFWFATLFFFTMRLMRFFFYLFLTEAVQFPLMKENQYILTLQEALLMKNLPIVQNLACLDLFLLAQQSPIRRQFFFTLSQPGGHPHNWNSLTENILILFNEYSDLLKKSTETHQTTIDSVKRLQNETIQPFSPIRFQSPINPRFGNLRNMSTFDIDDVNVVNVTYTNLQTLKMDKLKTAMNEKLNKAVEFMKMVLGINFFFGELPQANIQKCLGDGQLIIWASQGISELVVTSLKEDKYGIVQKDLPVLITAMVQLKQSLDKLNKVPALSRRIAALDDFNYKMKNAVAAAVKRSLFNICLHFSDYFKDLPLSMEIVHYLHVNIMLKNPN